MWRSPSVVIAAALLAACAATGPSDPAAATVPASFSKGAAGPSIPPADWWRAFGDPVLSDLIARARASSPDMAGAAARIRQAREQEAITHGGHGPQVNASGQASAARLSENALPSSLAGALSGGSGSGGLGLPGETFTTYQVGFDASWEFDLFGGQAGADRSARERTQAAVWSARDAEVVLTAEVARTYQQYRALQRRLALADEGLSLQREALDFSQVRARNGLVMDSDVRRQERAVDEAAARRDGLAAEAEIRLQALSTLLGLASPMLESELASSSPAPALVDIPPGLPSELLERRPDIRAAERQLAAATTDIGVARTDLYPKISLTGAAQLASRALSSLLETGSLQGSVGARISAPIFNRDRLRANVRLRQARADEAAAAYRKTVLSALGDVEDGLTRVEADRRRLVQLKAASLAAQDEADTAAVRYRNGLAPAFDVLTARLSDQAARDTLIQAQAAAAQDMIALYKALGGGWDERRTPISEDQPDGQDR